MIRTLGAVGCAFVAAGVAMALVFPWEAVGLSSWRTWPVIILALPVRFFTGAAVCAVAALWIGLLDRSRGAIREEFWEFSRRAAGVQRTNGEKLR